MKFFWKYIFPPVFGLMGYFTIRLLTDSVSGMKFWERSASLNVIEIVISIITGYILIAAINRLFRKFDTNAWSDFNYRIILKELLSVLVVSLFIQNLFLTTMAAFTDDGLQWFDVVDINLIPLFYTLIYYGVKRSVSLFKAYVNSKIEIEKITNEHLQTELKFLKAQYHPHFLFNALNTIYFQMDEDVAAAKKTVEHFSALLRYQLYDAHRKTTLSDEINYLQNFIKIQQLRVADRLKLTVDIEGNLNEEKVYPLLFLPLVENAFKYVGGDLKIDIKMYKQQDYIVFEVSNSIPANIPFTESKGIGLENLKRRLMLLYAEKYRFTTSVSNHIYTSKLQLALSNESVNH